MNRPPTTPIAAPASPNHLPRAASDPRTPGSPRSARIPGMLRPAKRWTALWILGGILFLTSPALGREHARLDGVTGSSRLELDRPFPGRTTPPPIPSFEERQAFVREHRRDGGLADAADRGDGVGRPDGTNDDGRPRAIHDEYDVTHYDVALDLNIGPRILTGTVTADAICRLEGITAMRLDLFSPMVVDGVTLNGSPAPYTHASGVITVTLDRPYHLDEAFTVSVRYHGTPAYSGAPFRWAAHGGVPIVCTYSEPYAAPAWWVCKDDPKDKATFAIHVTAPDTLFTVSNGFLSSVEDHHDGTATCHWTHQYPMSPYLFSITTTNYAHWSEDYTALDGMTTMPVDYFAYPEDEAKARVDWSTNIGMMEYYAGIFGEYPFLSEKYAIAEFSHTGAMEHQTATSMGFPWLTGDGSNDYVVAHELSHSWVGDMITMRTWGHAWTKEGFATLCEALYFEALYGSQYYHDYMDGLPVLSYAGQQLYNINPPLSPAIYYKGAWVLHMIRHVVGEEAFWQTLRDYTADLDLRYGVSDTEDLRMAFESASGTGLTWFFDEWIYQPGFPRLLPAWSGVPVQGGWDFHLNLQQTQTTGPIFKMPIDVEIHTTLGTERFVIWDSLASQDFTLRVAGQPLGLVIDPDHWLLWQLDPTTDVPEMGAPVVSTLRLVPNPVLAGEPAELSFSLVNPGKARVEVFDPAGRRVRLLHSGETPRGTVRLVWDGRGENGHVVPAGAYFYRILTEGKEARTRAIVVR